MLLHEDHLFPADPTVRSIARRLYSGICDLPLICPHGHADPNWFSENNHFSDPAALIVQPDQNIFKLLFSLGVPLETLGLGNHIPASQRPTPREIWRVLASHYHLFLGTPTRIWLDHTFQNLFGIDQVLSASNSDFYFDRITECLASDAFRPRALFDQFGVEVLATTDSPLDDLSAHQAIQDADWNGRIIPTYRGDPVIDPDFDGFFDNVLRLCELTGCDSTDWQGYLQAHRKRRADFRNLGATASDHGHPTPNTADLTTEQASALFDKIMTGGSSPKDRELFRAQMLTEMAGMSIEDGLVMQLHAGSVRNHCDQIFQRFGRDMGFDFPTSVNFVDGLRPMLNRYGLDPNLTLVLFTLDESCYGRELAPLAAAYPSIKLGPAWWFFDSPSGMLRFREITTETVGYHNLAGFNDDTRAITSLPARHDMARRIDCAFLADQVARHILREEDAHAISLDLTGGLVRATYRLNEGQDYRCS